jgi:hypothetical protein
MVDKKTKIKSDRDAVDQHNDGAGARYADLELRLAEVIKKFDCMASEMKNIQQQQQDLIELVKKLKK